MLIIDVYPFKRHFFRTLTLSYIKIKGFKCERVLKDVWLLDIMIITTIVSIEKIFSTTRICSRNDLLIHNYNATIRAGDQHQGRPA